MNYFDTIYTPQPIPEPRPYTPKKRGGKRVRHVTRLLTDDEVYEIRARRKLGTMMKILAIDYGVSRQTIGCVVHKRGAYART